jgi:enoyl-CoA hydratase
VSTALSVAALIGASDAPVVVADRGPVRFIVLNRPTVRNALTRQMRRDFPGLIAAAEAAAEVAAIVLTGAPPAFSGGVDLKERAQAGAAPLVRPNPGEVLRAAQKPVIAAVNGACATGALEMALSCTFIVAADEARFADTHARVGVVPRWGQLSLLPRAIGVRRARQMMATGEFIDARTALAWGLVNEVVPGKGLLDRCAAIGAAIATADARCLATCLAALTAGEAAAGAAGDAIEAAAISRHDDGQ